ncbi:CaiB/BaiF CoA transferase family protein [uncultured Jatrophihabitans sp.]|uniref:CaiB/BaiF CoA transferase family protein n=1 Tax=uncultured Jatrophihabitans sp. TaxID=1610747 RepID=UPI0035CBA3AB
MKVVDLTQMLAGPYCTMILADLGADVIKVEPPNGDMVRELGPFAVDDDQRWFGGYFQSVNRNKRSVALDLKRPEGREALLAITDTADVVVENYRSGVMDRLGIGYELLAERNPRLVYAAIRGFGDERTGRSPYRQWPAFDVVAQAIGGLVGINGPPGQPTKAGPGIGDMFPAVLAAVGILAALRSAERTGRGQFVDVAMSDAVLALCERVVYQYSYGGVIAAPEGNGHPMLCPFDVFPARDGWVAIAAHRDHFWAELCARIDRPELAADARYATNPARVAHRNEVEEIITSWTRERSRAEIVEVMGGVVPCGAVNDAESLSRDPHFAARDMLVTLDQPGSSGGYAVVGSPIKLTGDPVDTFRRAPLLGEDARDVLREVGFDDLHIDELRSSGTLTAAPFDRRGV